MAVILLLFFASFFVSKGGQQTCPALQKWPSGLINNKFTGSYSFGSVDSTGGLGDGFLMEAAEYLVPDTCTCGVLYKWIFLPRNTAGAKIQFQVWEHYNTSNYRLKGENYFYVPGGAGGQYLEFLVPEKDRITIRNNYLIGWYTKETNGIIAYYQDTGTDSLTDEARTISGMADLDPNNEPIYSWQYSSTVVTQNKNKIYAIGAEAYPNTAPAFTNLPRTVRIYSDEVSGAVIYEISASDIDSRDVKYLDIYDINEDSTSYFYYDRASQTVYLARDSPPANSYTMTFQVQDQCMNTATATLTIEVLNWAPTLENLPAFASIDEDTADSTVLYNVEWTDRDDSTLQITYSGNPTKMDFRSDGHGQCDTTCAANVTLLTDGTGNLAYSAGAQYIVDVKFTDSKNHDTDTGYFMLYVNRNKPPQFTNLDNGAKAYASYLTTAKGDVIYTVSATDEENDRLVFSMTCDPDPSGCPLKMTNDYSNGAVGVISATRDFRGLTNTGWDISIKVKDVPVRAPGVEVGPKYLSVIVQDINFIPLFVNLPLDNPIAVHEGTALGTTLFTVTYLDVDTSDNHTFLVYYDNTWAVNYFQLDNKTGVLTTEHNVLDYETVYSVTSVTLTINITDGVDTATETLAIKIRNVNEAPSFHQNKYTLEVGEEGTVTASAGNWNPEMTDPDIGDTHKYTWDCGDYTRYLRMDVDTGAVTYATNFDYDEVNFTAPYDCVVTVRDKAGLTATTTIEVDIHDENDNPPVFDLSTDYYIFQTPYLDPGRFVGQVTATDGDRDEDNKAIFYSWYSYPDTLNRSFLRINDYGNIYVNESWSQPLFDFDTSYTLVVLAENIKNASTGGRMTATATVILYLFGTSTTTAITTDRPLEFIEDNRNVIWLAVAITAGGVLLIVLCGFTMVYTIQVKRYRWCIPWCRKRLLGLKKMTRREKRRYYLGLLMQEELEEYGSDSDDGQPISTLNFEGRHTTFYDDNAPPMMWERLKNKAGAKVGEPQAVPRGPTVRTTAPRASVADKKSKVPQAATYEEPKPPQKKDVSRMMKTAHSKFWTS